MNKSIVLSWLFIGVPFFFVNGQPKNLNAKDILSLIPSKIKDYYITGEPQSKVVQLGTIQYAVAEKRFASSRKRSIKVLLFDYKEAPIMYNQATRKFHNFETVETDTLILRPVFMKDCTGWESYNSRRRSSQILLGICNRYFLIVEGGNVELEILKNIVLTFKVEDYPK